MSVGAKQARWLIIVRRDRRDLYENLRQAIEPSARVEVILDRRQESPSGAAAPAEVDRLGRHRRKPLTPRQLDLWETTGFLLIYTGEDLQIYEAEDQPSGKPARARLPGEGPEG